LGKLFVFAACWVGTAASVHAQAPLPRRDPLELPVLRSPVDPTIQLQVQTDCSRTKARTPLAVVSWNAPAAAQGLQRVDLTVYKQGFDKDIYSMVWPLERGQNPRPSSAAKLLGRPADGSLGAHVETVAFEADTGRATVTFEGLEPGLLYLWRVCRLTERGWVPGQMARASAPACPADLIDSEEDREP
jgi:hypothetical protein